MTKQTEQQTAARKPQTAKQAALGYTFSWEDDWQVDHAREFPDSYAKGGPETCEGCVMRDESGKVVQSLWCIDDASREYRRVVEAELALEELG